MKLKTITWKLRDPKEVYFDYPDIDVKSLSKITCPEDLYKQFKFLFENEVVEKFIVFWLSSANKVTGFEIVSVGTLNSSLVSPREVFRGAVINHCANIILGHNHPSQNLEPSQEDISITKKLIECGKLMEINVFDHLIFSSEGFTSLIERRII